MDPITATILSVLPALASDMVKTGVKDAYEGLKAVIRRKWGDAAPISRAITAVEQDPTSRAQAAVVTGGRWRRREARAEKYSSGI